MVDTIFEFISWFSQNTMEFVLPFVLVLSILVFVHEFGHYYVARKCGVRVDVFSIGFGKELFGFNDKNGTRWKFCLVPLGGYVKMFGDVDPASTRHDETIEGDDGERRTMTEAEREVAFFNKSVGKRAAIVFAGPAINFLFAIVVLTCVFSIQGKVITPPVAAAIIKGGSADNYGIQPHDRIVEINGRAIERFEDIQRQVTIALDQGMSVRLVRDGKLMLNESVRPERVEVEDRHGFTHSRGMLGIMAAGASLDLDGMVMIDGIDVSKMTEKQKKAVFVSKMDRQIDVEIKSGENSTTYIIHPLSEQNADFIKGDTDRPVLSGIGENDIMAFSPLGALIESFKETEEIVSGTLDALGQMFTGVRSTKELGGIIRIGAIAGDAAQAGTIALLTFAALLSINLGLLNLFPIPVLDGGSFGVLCHRSGERLACS